MTKCKCLNSCVLAETLAARVGAVCVALLVLAVCAELVLVSFAAVEHVGSVRYRVNLKTVLCRLSWQRLQGWSQYSKHFVLQYYNTEFLVFYVLLLRIFLRITYLL